MVAMLTTNAPLGDLLGQVIRAGGPIAIQTGLAHMAAARHAPKPQPVAVKKPVAPVKKPVEKKRTTRKK